MREVVLRLGGSTHIKNVRPGMIHAGKLIITIIFNGDHVRIWYEDSTSQTLSNEAYLYIEGMKDDA